MAEIIAIIANADSFWVQRYINNVSVPLKHRVVLVSGRNEKYKQFYESCGIEVITTKPARNSRINHRINALIASWNTVCAVNSIKPDIVHIHYAYPYILRLMPYLTHKAKTIITFWGSDLLRADNKTIRLISLRSRKADALVVGAEDLYEKLISLDDGLEKKTSLIRMGLTAFDAIDKKRSNRAEAIKNLLGRNEDERKIITIGYNAGKAQQHIKVLDSLALLPDEIKQKMIIVLPLTYQNEDTDYLNKIRDSLEKAKIEGILLTEFMDDDLIADLCLSTDIFINAQTSDAISGSMLEHIYAGTLVINGEWLKYYFLDNNGIRCFTFNDFEKLRELIINLVSEKIVSYDVDKSVEIVKDNFSWGASRIRWNSLYNKLYEERTTRNI